MPARGTLRTRCLTRRRHKPRRSAGAGTLSKAGAWTHAWTLAKAGTRAGRCARRRAARGVHGAPCAGGSWRSTRCAGARTLAGSAAWAAIEDRTPALNASAALRSRGRRRDRGNDRGGIDRTRPGLRHDNAARCRSRLNRSRCHWRSGYGCRRRRWSCRHRRWRCRDHSRLRDNMGRRRSSGNHFACRRRWCRNRCGGHNAGRRDRGLRDNWAGWRFGGNRRGLRRRRSDDGRGGARLRNNPARSRCLCRLRSRRDWSGTLRGRSRCCRYRSRLSCNDGLRRSQRRGRGYGCRSYRSSRHRAWRRRCRLFFLLLNGLKYIARLRDARPVDLRLGSRGVRTLAAGCAGPAALKVSTHTLGFVELQRTGVRLLLRDADIIENIQDSPALDFQFTR
jgi:hypothetical protein